MTIAVTGATGAVGGRVARLLAEDLRTDLRLVVRDPSRAPDERSARWLLRFCFLGGTYP